MVSGVHLKGVCKASGRVGVWKISRRSLEVVLVIS